MDKLTGALVVLLILTLAVAGYLGWVAAQRTLREHAELQETLRHKHFMDAVYGSTEIRPPVPKHPTDSKKYKIWENYKP